MAKAIFQLEPLTCPSCMQKIETVLMKTAGVRSAKVYFNTSKVRAEFDDSATTAAELEIAITKLGYPVKSVKVSPS